MTLLTNEEGDVTLTVPMVFSNKGAMLGAPVSDQLKCIDQAKLAGNVILQSYARARAWLKMLNLGYVRNQTELVNQLKLDHGNFTRTFRLAFLSPRIIRAVMNGLAPRDLSLAKLMEIRTEDWDEQERQLGLNIGSGSIGSGVRPQSRSDDKARCERTSESPAPVRDSRESEVPQTEEVDLEVII